MAPKPKFARPPCVIEFSSEKNFIDTLLEHKVPYWEWGEADRLKAGKEVIEGDAVYSRAALFERPIVVRCIDVIAARVHMRHPVYGTLVLVEYVRNGDQYEPRRQQDSSLSEKMLLDPSTGVPIETPEQTIIRCLRQETGMLVSPKELSGGRMHFMPAGTHDILTLSRFQRIEGFGDKAAYVEQDFGKSTKFPLLITHRQVAKYTVELDPRRYKVQGYMDPDTRYYSLWRSVRDQGVLEPIAAHLINRIQRKRAVA